MNIPDAPEFNPPWYTRHLHPWRIVRVDHGVDWDPKTGWEVLFRWAVAAPEEVLDIIGNEVGHATWVSYFDSAPLNDLAVYKLLTEKVGILPVKECRLSGIIDELLNKPPATTDLTQEEWDALASTWQGDIDSLVEAIHLTRRNT